MQEGIIAMLAAVAYLSTSPEARERNAFTFAPLVEVAVLSPRFS